LTFILPYKRAFSKLTVVRYQSELLNQLFKEPNRRHTTRLNDSDDVLFHAVGAVYTVDTENDQPFSSFLFLFRGNRGCSCPCYDRESGGFMGYSRQYQGQLS